MTITSKSSSGQNTTTSGKYVQAFIQKRCGTKWVPIGCSNISDLTFDPRTMSYNICIGPDGRRRQTKITREDDPRPITMVYDLTNSINRGKALGLHRRQLDGCTHNMLIKVSDCPQVDSAALDPANFSDAVILYNLSETGGFQFGNNTLRSRDDRQADDLLGQTTYVFDGYAYLNKYTPSLMTLPDPIDFNVLGFVAYGEGACADGVCSDCDKEACQKLAYVDSNSVQTSSNAGSTWSSAGGMFQMLVQFDGKLFVTTPANFDMMRVSTDHGQTWVSVTSHPLTWFYDVERIDANTYVAVARDFVSGPPPWTYKTLISHDGGYTWTLVSIHPFRIENIVWDGTVLTGIGTNVGGDVTIYTSRDYGKSWSVAASTTTPGPDFSFATYYSGSDVFAMGGNRLFKRQCDANGQQSFAEVNGPFSGTATGIGGCKDNCNELWVTSNTGKVFYSIDGGATWTDMPMPGITVTADPIRNVVTCCGNSVYTVFGASVVVWRAAGANGASLDPFSS